MDWKGPIMAEQTSVAAVAVYTVEEWVSGNGRNRCASVCKGEEVVAAYHIRDYGRGFLKIAQAEADRLNALERVGGAS